MTYPHVIRLRGPWDYEVLRDCGRTPLPKEKTAGRCKLPADWGDQLGDDFRGVVRYVRHFHQPTNLQPHDHVWLVCDGADAHAQASINEQPLGGIPGHATSAEFPLTRFLQPRNQVTIDVELPEDADEAIRLGRMGRPGGLIGEVRLEIRSPQYVQDLSVFCEQSGDNAPQWMICGKIVGEKTNSPLRIIVSNGKSDLRLDEVRPGSEFKLDIDNSIMPGNFQLPDWRPDAPALGMISVELCPGGGVASDTAAAEWLVEVATAVGPLGVQHARYFVPAIESPDFYDVLDQRGLPIVQVLPPQWDVHRQRLAHHPSIVAFAVSQERLATCSFGCAVENPQLWGRPVGFWPQVQDLPVLAGRIPE